KPDTKAAKDAVQTPAADITEEGDLVAPGELVAGDRVPGRVAQFSGRTQQSIQRFARLSIAQSEEQLDGRVLATQDQRLSMFEQRLDQVAGAPTTAMAPTVAGDELPATGAEPTAGAMPDRVAAIRREANREQQAILRESQEEQQRAIAQA